jgi:4-hydroxybenzoate polyprenyltransferase
MGASSNPSPAWHAAFWRGYWITLRPYLFFVSGASGLVGLALAPDLPVAVLAAAATSFFFSYGLGQALTDVFQTDTDALSSPYRPLVRGEISRVEVLAVSLGGLAACAVVLSALNPWNAPLAVTIVAGLLAYTPMKRRFWAGPPWNAWIVALLPVMGFLCGVPSLALAVADPRLPAAAGSVFFSYAAFVLLGYFKDVEADREAGYDTLPVRFGRRLSVAVSALFVAGALLSSLVLLARGEVDGAAGFPAFLALGGWGAGILLLVGAHLRILPTTRDEEAHRAIGLCLRGFVALHLAEAVWLRPSLAPFAAGAYVLFEVALARRPCESQI